MTATAHTSLAGRMAEGYLQAAVFALEAGAEARRTVDLRRQAMRGALSGPEQDATMAALGVAVLTCEFWRDEAARCEAICAVLSGMIDEAAA